MRKLFTFFFFFVFNFSINAQVEEVRRITKTLCSPEFQGRGYVNSGDSIAASFIADEFMELFPELVQEDGEDKIKSINYTSIIALLVKEIQTLKQKI